MIRNLKVLGLALVAMLAMTAVAASAASAAAPEFHSESAPVTFKGSQTEKHKFTTSAGTVECKVAAFEGTNSATTSTTATLSASYKECTAFGFLSATVNMRSCDYLFHLVAGSNPPTATTDVVCTTAGDFIEVSTFGCTAKVFAQNGLTHTTFANAEPETEGEPAPEDRDIDATINVTNVAYNLSAFCPGGGGNKTGGVYEGKATIQGFTGGGAQQGIWVA